MGKQKANYVSVASVFLECAETDVNFLKYIITSDEIRACSVTPRLSRNYHNGKLHPHCNQQSMLSVQ